MVRDGVEIRLTPKEFELLTLLARNQDRVLTHRAILKAIWGGNAVEQPEHLWTLMSQLRKKIEPDPASRATCAASPGWAIASARTTSRDAIVRLRNS